MQSNYRFTMMDNTPEVIPVSSGFVPEFRGSTSDHVIDIMSGGGARSVSANTNQVNLHGHSVTDVTVERSGTNLVVRDESENMLVDVLVPDADKETLVYFEDGRGSFERDADNNLVFADEVLEWGGDALSVSDLDGLENEGLDAEENDTDPPQATDPNFRFTMMDNTPEVRGWPR